MSNIDNFKAFHSMDIKLKLSAEEERLAIMREHQRRERKEKLYSNPLPLNSRKPSS